MRSAIISLAVFASLALNGADSMEQPSEAGFSRLPPNDSNPLRFGYREVELGMSVEEVTVALRRMGYETPEVQRREDGHIHSIAAPLWPAWRPGAAHREGPCPGPASCEVVAVTFSGGGNGARAERIYAIIRYPAANMLPTVQEVVLAAGRRYGASDPQLGQVPMLVGREGGSVAFVFRDRRGPHIGTASLHMEMQKRGLGGTYWFWPWQETRWVEVESSRLSAVFRVVVEIDGSADPHAPPPLSVSPPASATPRF